MLTREAVTAYGPAVAVPVAQIELASEAQASRLPTKPSVKELIAYGKTQIANYQRIVDLFARYKTENLEMKAINECYLVAYSGHTAALQEWVRAMEAGDPASADRATAKVKAAHEQVLAAKQRAFREMKPHLE